MIAEASAIPARLREKYLVQLAVRRAELARFLARCEQRLAASGDCEAARIHAHSLRGTGRTYGYPDISATGLALEEAINTGASQTALAALIRVLIASCDSAIQEGNRTPRQVCEPDIASVKAALRNSEPKPSVLIVDDDPAIRGLLEKLLSRDADVLTASDGEEALAIIARSKPDLVILDDRMPGMTGLKMLEQLRGDGKPLPTQVVMLTANNRTPDILSGMSAGAIDYITKPFEPDRLVNRVRSLLKRQNMTILVADDDAAVRGLLQHKFRMLGFRLLYAEDGEEAFRLMHAEKPHLAIIDRMMPGLDGLAVLQKIRAEETLCSTPVILLTAKRQNKDVIEGFENGATDYIAKPFVPDEVVARAMRLLEANGSERP